MFFKVIPVLVFNLICCIIYADARNDCMRRYTEYGIVCVCTASYCDYLENPKPIDKNVVIISSSKKGERFAVRKLQFNKTQPKESIIAVLNSEKAFNLKVNRSKQYQNITGFGGSFTGAASYVLGLLDTPLQDHFYKSYYHKDGIGYNLMRMPIGGSDFDFAPWAYNEQPTNDLKLSNFTKLDPRDELRVKQLQRLKLIAKLENLKIMGSAWSPPPWMKTNNNWTGNSELKQDFYQTWADYHLRFIELMNGRNMPIWAITTGNEPTIGNVFVLIATFMSLGWSPLTHGIWVNDHLGPTIRKSKYNNVLIFGGDDNRFTFPYWVTLMNFTRPGVTDYLDGLAMHNYLDDLFDVSLIDLTLAKFPGKILLNTEFSIGVLTRGGGPQLGSWERGEMYVRDYLLPSLKHFSSGWIDWNLGLDDRGGPNYVGSFIDAAIIVNATNRAEFYKQPMFYAIGHFSKFVPEGSVRINVTTMGTSVDAMAFKRPDDRIAVVLLNSDEKDDVIVLSDSKQGQIKLTIPAKSWHTVIYN